MDARGAQAAIIAAAVVLFTAALAARVGVPARADAPA
jgi:hypothetical protein